MIDPKDWPIVGTIDRDGALTVLPLPPSEIVVAAESEVFEVDLIVRASGQPDTVISREYVSKDKKSTDGAAEEIWAGVSDSVKARMHPVNDSN
jgi:hypothetical protein